jgi:hypothetical protein
MNSNALITSTTDAVFSAWVDLSVERVPPDQLLFEVVPAEVHGLKRTTKIQKDIDGQNL